MKFGINYILAFIIIFLLSGIDPGYAAEKFAQQDKEQDDEITIIENGSSGVTIVYKPEINYKNVENNSEKYTVFELRSASYEDQPGSFLIPKRNLVLGIPENSDPVVNVVEYDYYTINNVNIERSQEKGNEVSGYPENTPVPSVIFSIEKSGYVRMQKILPVILNPVQYDPVQNTARIARNITINVNFNAPGTAGQASTGNIQDAGFNDNYREILSNFSQSRIWRKTSETLKKNQANLFLSGYWYSIPVTEEGIYKLTMNDLSGYGIEPDNIDPRTIRIFNNGGRELPEDINSPRPDGLIENPILVSGEEDGSFDPDDYILFYASGPKGWEYNEDGAELNHYKNVYAEENIYWFTYGGVNGKRMETVQFNESSVDVENAMGLYYREDEHEKMHHSGNDYYMKILYSGEEVEYDINLEGYDPGTEATLRISAASDLFVNQNLAVSVNGNLVKNETIFGDPRSISAVILPDVNGNISLKAVNSTSSTVSQIYLDWIEIEYQKELKAASDKLKYFSNGNDQIVNYSITGFNDNTVSILKITEPGDIIRYEYIAGQGSGNVVFSDLAVNSGNQYFIAGENSYLTVPQMMERSVNDLRITGIQADLLIITPFEFIDAADKLREFRETYSDLRTKVVSIEDVYANFSGGLQDPVAIRDFVKFAFENWRTGPSSPPGYLLLLGDGNYDYRNLRSSSSINRIPPYEVNNVRDLYTLATDDFYGYVSGDDRFLDLAVGRLPVQSSSMAMNVVNKIIKYQEEPLFGSWRNRFVFTADDEKTSSTYYERIHTDQSEFISKADYIPGFLNKKKIYMMEYPEVRNLAAEGIRKPDAQNALIDQINEGALIINYFGHGNERLLAHEWFLSREMDMPRIENYDKLFFLYLASCTFGRWDMPVEDSMGELLVTSADIGAIAIISSVRDVFSGLNFSLADDFFSNLFTDSRTTETLGNALMRAKILNRSINSEKFHLLGDPTLVLEMPKNNISISSIEPDTLKALAKIKISGTFLSDPQSNSTIFLSVFDSEKTGEHLMDNGEPVNYKLPGAPIFKGNKTIDQSSGNSFEMSFIVPKDITYGGTNGRISLYAWDENSDASAFLDQLYVGGTQLGIADNTGPEIQVYFDEREFVSGDIVPDNSEIRINLTDNHGINITGDVGHKIEMMLDENIIDLSSLFEYENGSYSSGNIEYSIGGINEGEHTFSIRAWDNFNNSSTYKGIMEVVPEGTLIVKNVLNYPNPFSGETQFTCQINAPAEIEIKIFTVNGRLIKKILDYHPGDTSFYVSLLWDGRDEDGDIIANGTYFYKIIARSNVNGELIQIEKIEKLVIMR
ncbi:type IX secretion system sortase PorU [candidate division KSB1 bacterium]